MEWNTDGSMTVEVPGPGTVLLVPMTKMLRIPGNRPDLAKLEERVIRMRGFDRKIRVEEAGTIDVSEFQLAFPPRVRITGVRAYHRRPAETVREFDKRGRATKKVNVAQKWELLESWECAAGEEASQAKLKRVREGVLTVVATEGSTTDGEG